MHQKIKTFQNPKKGKGQAHVYQENEKFYVAVETARGYQEQPVQYNSGAIAYDFPDRVPLYVKELAAQAFDYIKQAEATRKAMQEAANDLVNLCGEHPSTPINDAVCENCSTPMPLSESQQCHICGMDGLGNCCIGDGDHHCSEIIP